MLKAKIKYNLLFLFILSITIPSHAGITETVDPQNYQYSITITGELLIDGILLTDVNDTVFAYVNDECRGIAPVLYISSVDIYIVMLTVFSNVLSGEDIVFKIKDNSAGTLITCTNAMTFQSEDNWGTPSNPYQINGTLTTDIDQKTLSSKPAISCYPNPTQGIMHISSEVPLGNAIVEIYNTKGLLVKKLDNTENNSLTITIDLSDLDNHIYILKVKTQTNTFIKKVKVVQ